MAAPAMTDLSFCCTVSHGRDARATFLFYAGSLRSPPANFLSPRWGEIRYRIYET